MMETIFKLGKPKHFWGDYGHILVDGMSMHQGRANGLIQLERTGPFIPPISFPGVWDIIVTDEFKQKIEHSGLTGFVFKPVIKAHIVLLEWEKWDLTQPEPPQFPSTGEPEDYILEEPHSPQAAEQMGDLWELSLLQVKDFDAVATDFWKIEEKGYNFVSEAGKLWLEQHVPRWINCVPHPKPGC